MLQIIKPNKEPLVRSTNFHVVLRGGIVMTTRSRGTSRKVDPWKRDIGSRDPAGRIPFIPPNRSRYIGARLTSAQISWPVYPRYGWFSGFSEGFEGHDAAGKLFYINRGLTGEVHWMRRFRKRKKNYPRARARATLRESVNRNLLPLHGGDLQISKIALAQITRVISMRVERREREREDMFALFIIIRVMHRRNFKYEE